MMKNKRHLIAVRDASGNVVETIQRVLRSEQIGNFNPMFCIYKKTWTLVQSDEGDISDPFRRTEKYLATLFIVPRNPDQQIANA